MRYKQEKWCDGQQHVGDFCAYVEFIKRLDEIEDQYDLRGMDEALSCMESLISGLCNVYGIMVREQVCTLTAMHVQNLASARLLRNTSRRTRSLSHIVSLGRSIRW